MSIQLTPKEIVNQLDRYIVGQNEAKKSVAVALRNRWRRSQVDSKLRKEIIPRNILMVGSTGVGKTEIARRLATLTGSPFIKVEATRYTEVGYVGKDVEQIIRDLVEIAIKMVRKEHTTKIEEEVAPICEDIIINAYLGKTYSEEDKQSALELYRGKLLDEKEIEIEVTPKKKPPVLDMGSGQVGMINIGEMLEGSLKGGKKEKRKVKIKLAKKLLMEEESSKKIHEEDIVEEALYNVENNGIVFIDEIDKITGSQNGTRGEVSREGVQRDLLPLVEGTVVTTKYGSIKTDYILFIASGAFHLSKPSEMLPELQGRFPVAVQLHSLNKQDFIRILKEPESNLLKQYKELLKVENVDVEFTEEGIDKIADLAQLLNDNIENIGARRLQTVLEKILEDISYQASEMGGQKINIDDKFIDSTMIDYKTKKDLSKFIL